MGLPNKKPLPKRLKFDQKLLNSSRATPQSSPLLQLPSPVLSRIYTQITHPRDQISFALTSKCVAKVSTSHRLNTITSQHWGKLRIYRHNNLMSDMLRWNYIPSHLKLCSCCNKYLPLRRIWHDRNGRELYKLKLVDWPWMVMDWMTSGRNCPTCAMPEDFVEGEEFVQIEPSGLARWVPVRHKLLVSKK